MIRGSISSRLHFPEAEDVQKATRPSSSGTIQVGVATAAPDRRNVVDTTYFSSVIAIGGCDKRETGWLSLMMASTVAGVVRVMVARMVGVVMGAPSAPVTGKMMCMGVRPGVVAEVLSRLPAPGVGRVVLVCVEGLGGAGKSVLAGALADARPDDVCLVHGDDFYGPEERDWRSWGAREGYERYFDHRRLEREVLRPLRAGCVARFRRYDWAANRLDGWVEVPPRGLVIVEGVYLLRAWLRPYWDFAVYVDAPREIRQARLRGRGENDEGWISRWTAAEDYYEMAEEPAASADLVVRGWRLWCGVRPVRWR